MEAATPLRQTHVRSIGDRVAIDGLVVDDDAAVRLVRAREEAGDDPVKLVLDAIGIGARVLDREQTGANAEFVRNEFDKVSREVEQSFTQQAGAAGEQLKKQLDEVFAPEGFLARSLERHFSDDSSGAVQHRVKQVVEEVTRQAQQELLKQFFSADSANPLAEFKAGVIRAVHQAGQRQDTGLRNLDQRMAGLQEQLGALKAERDKLAELEAERERGAAKGRTFEELVHDEIDRIAAAQGDDCDAVGDVNGAGGRVGDVLVGIDACRGPARGRIVFEAKNSKLSKNRALQELDEALHQRDADFAVLVVPSEDKLPARMRPLREFNGDKLIVDARSRRRRGARARGRLLARPRPRADEQRRVRRDRRRRGARDGRARPPRDGGRAQDQVAAERSEDQHRLARASSSTRWPNACATTSGRSTGWRASRAATARRSRRPCSTDARPGGRRARRRHPCGGRLWQQDGVRRALAAGPDRQRGRVRPRG